MSCNTCQAKFNLFTREVNAFLSYYANATNFVSDDSCDFDTISFFSLHNLCKQIVLFFNKRITYFYFYFFRMVVPAASFLIAANASSINLNCLVVG